MHRKITSTEGGAAAHSDLPPDALGAVIKTSGPDRLSEKTAKPRIDFEAVKERALNHLAEVLEDFLALETKQVGKEIQMLNPLRQDYEHGSFSINTETGAWADFADDSPDQSAKGGDVVSLVAYLKRCGQAHAAGWLQHFLDSLDGGNVEPVDALGAALSAASNVNGTSTSPGAMVGQAPNKVAKGKSPPESLPVAKSPAAQGEAIPRLTFNKAGWGPVVAEYLYADRRGLPCGKVLRFEHDGKKTFSNFTLDRDKDGKLTWKPEALKEPRPLFNLHQLASKPDAIVVLCEGEKAANAVSKFWPSTVHTTTMGGANAAAKSDFRALDGRQVLVWPDNDPAGTKYATDVCRLIHDMAPSANVRILVPPKFTPGHDAGAATLLPREEVPVGWDAADAVAEGWTADHMTNYLKEPGALAKPEADSGPTDAARPEKHSNARELPPGFVLNEDAVWAELEKKDGSFKLVWLSSRIDVIASTRSAESQAWGTLVEFRDRDGVAHRWCIPQGMFGDELQEVWRTLLSLGCEVAVAADRRSLLAEYLQGCKPAARGLAVSQPGWIKETFVFPDGTSYGSGDSLISFETRDPVNQRSFVAAGTLDEWNASIAPLCVGNSRLTLAVCAALAGPTLLLLGEENGGFHYRGPSSIGKTTILKVASSVWGHPAKVMRSWRATSNGLEATAAQHNDMLLPLDEMGEITPHEAANVSYMLANGQGKARANVTGGARQTARWRLIIQSTGEVALADHLQSAGIQVRAGQETRLVDVEADPGAGHGLYEVLHGYQNGALLSQALVQAADRHYGSLGRAFVEHLANPAHRDASIAHMRLTMTDFEERCVSAEASGQVRRVAHRFALVAAAGELAVHAGLLPWSPGEAVAAARTCFLGWVERRGGTTELEQGQACNLVRHHLERFGDRHFKELRTSGIGDDQAGLGVEVHGYKRAAADRRTQYLIIPSVFEREICRGYDCRSVQRHLKEAGMLMLDGEGKATQSIRTPDQGKKRLMVINPDLLGEADPPQAVPGAELRLVSSHGQVGRSSPA